MLLKVSSLLSLSFSLTIYLSIYLSIGKVSFFYYFCLIAKYYRVIRINESPDIVVLKSYLQFHCYISSTNQQQARIDKTKQNSKCRLCVDRDETINHIINEASQLAQKEYKTRHDWVGRVIHWELCKKFKFDHTNICTAQHLSWRMTHKLQ